MLDHEQLQGQAHSRFSNISVGWIEGRIDVWSNRQQKGKEGGRKENWAGVKRPISLCLLIQQTCIGSNYQVPHCVRHSETNKTHL